MIKGKKIIITGGTGTIGKNIALQLSGNDVTIFSRSERSQAEMRLKHPQYNYMVGDITDYPAVFDAINGHDYCFHTAALKRIEVCEEQPMEACRINMFGSANVINACVVNGCKLINISTDKAINPSSVYGRTKALVENMVNQACGCNIRSGNVLWSSGSVLNIWVEQIKQNNSITITSVDMTRFFIKASDLASFVVSHADSTGTFTVPMQSYKLIDIAEKFIESYGNKSTKIKITGLRPGERLHEYRDEKTCSADNLSTNIWPLFTM